MDDQSHIVETQRICTHSQSDFQLACISSVICGPTNYKRISLQYLSVTKRQKKRETERACISCTMMIALWQMWQETRITAHLH